MPRRAIQVSVLALACAMLAGCASAPKLSNKPTVDPKYGVVASPRVVETAGGPIDKRDARIGREMIGKPYTIAGKRYFPQLDSAYDRVGSASWYGDDFHGRLTANGEVFNMHDISAAHPTMPLPSYARVTNMKNSRSIVVRVNDRGPFHGGRLIDVSKRAATLLAFKDDGVGRVRVQYLGKASPRGSDEEILAATLRTDGSMAPQPAYDGAPVMVAEAPLPPTRPALEPLPVLQASYAPVAEPMPAIGDPAAVAPGTAGMQAGVVPLPPDRPLDLMTIPSADTPVADPYLVPVPRHKAKANERTASLEPRSVVTYTARLSVNDIVGEAATLGETPMVSPVLAYAAPEGTPDDAPNYFVNAGAYREKANAERLAAKLGPSGSVEMAPLQRGGDTLWVVRAGPFADREIAAVVAQQAVAAGAAGARVAE